MVRKQEGVKRGIWTSHEDKLLSDYIVSNGVANWRTLPAKAGLKRCGKSCRLRWLNYLRPGIKRGSITNEEEDLILKLHNLLGNKWSLIAGRLPGRTDNEIKNYWNTCLRKKAMKKTSSQSKLKGESSHKIDEIKSKESMDPTIIYTKAISCTNWSIQTTSSHENCGFATATWQFDPFLDYSSNYNAGFEINDGNIISIDENCDLMRSSNGEMEESMNINSLIENDAWDLFSL